MQFDSQKYLYSQKLTKYFLAKLPSKLIIAPATIQGNTVLWNQILLLLYCMVHCKWLRILLSGIVINYENSLLLINVNILPSMNSFSNKTITFNSESDINREEQSSRPIVLDNDNLYSQVQISLGMLLKTKITIRSFIFLIQLNITWVNFNKMKLSRLKLHIALTG